MRKGTWSVCLNLVLLSVSVLSKLWSDLNIEISGAGRLIGKTSFKSTINGSRAFTSFGCAYWKEKSYLKENLVIVYSALDGKSGEV